MEEVMRNRCKEQGTTTVLADFISKRELRKKKIKGKPRCPYCGRPLAVVYEGAAGQTSEKCENCHNFSLLDMGEMKAYKICDDAVGM